jgi:Cu+-exporting ATPase
MVDRVMSTSQENQAPEADAGTATLLIDGMTCASCVARVEKRLEKIEGVSARVNLATEKARVTYPSTVAVDQLVAAVGAAGYTARVEEPRTAPRPESATPDAPRPHDHAHESGGMNHMDHGDGSTGT